MRYYLRPRCIGIIFAHQVAHFLFHFTLQYLHAGFTQITLGGSFGGSFWDHFLYSTRGQTLYLKTVFA
jgi:hypothetical protein